MMGDVNSPTSSSAFDLSTNQTTSTTSTVVIMPPPSTSVHQVGPESPVHQVLPERFWKSTTKSSKTEAGNSDEDVGEHTVLINKVEQEETSRLDEALDEEEATSSGGAAASSSAMASSLKISSSSPCSSSSSYIASFKLWF